MYPFSLLMRPWDRTNKVVEDTMKTNEGNADRAIRVVIAIVAAVAAGLLGFTSVVGIILLVVAAVMLVTAAVGFCPLYRVFGINTCKVPSSSKQTVAAK